MNISGTVIGYGLLGKKHDRAYIAVEIKQIVGGNGMKIVDPKNPHGTAQIRNIWARKEDLTGLRLEQRISADVRDVSRSTRPSYVLLRRELLP